MRAEIIGFHFDRGLYADLERRIVLREGKPLDKPLTKMEFDVLECYLIKPNVLVKRTDVAPLNDGISREGRPVDHYIAKINSKLGWDKVLVVTRGIGFTLQTNVQALYARDREKGIEILKISEFNSNIHTIRLLRSSLEQTLEVIRLNPYGLPDAHIRAAYNYANLCMAAYSAELPHEVMPKARNEALLALDHPSTRSKAHGVLGLISVIYDYNWQEAEKHFSAALESSPDPRTLLYYAHFSITSGRFQEGIRAADKAARLAPEDPIIYASWGWINFLTGDTEQGIRLGLQALSRHPGFAPAHNMLGWAYEADGQYELALNNYEQSLKADYHPAALWSLGHLYGRMGQHAKILAIEQELNTLHERGAIKRISAYGRALIHAGRQELDQCLVELERAYHERCDWLMHLALEKRWEPLRQAPQFADLIIKIGMPYRGQLSPRGVISPEQRLEMKDSDA